MSNATDRVRPLLPRSSDGAPAGSQNSAAENVAGPAMVVPPARAKPSAPPEDGVVARSGQAPLVLLGDRRALLVQPAP